MTPEAEAVLRVIRWWSRTDPSGPKFVQIRSACRSREIARAGLDWLKEHRLVTWTDEGAATRYAESKTKATAA